MILFLLATAPVDNSVLSNKMNEQNSEEIIKEYIYKLKPNLNFQERNQPLLHLQL